MRRIWTIGVGTGGRGGGGGRAPDFFVWWGPTVAPTFEKCRPIFELKVTPSELISRRESRQMYHQSEQWKLKHYRYRYLYYTGQ